MEQVIVRKQGRYDYSAWSSRVLTLDPLSGVLLLSKKGAPEQLHHHAMQPTVIEVWPYYDSKYVEEDYSSVQAKLTIRLAGSAFPRPTYKGTPIHKARVLNSAGMDTDEAWVLRFTTLEDFRAALLALEHLTRTPLRETSDASFGAATNADAPAVLPATATELLKPIQRAWLLGEVRKREKKDAVRMF